ncbi:MAG: phosphate ABC transporter permease PstA [Candidatus Brockarchaeota archaeon]|nr:phosphate ABC transporter permease PstA [Candidatus Brockarchaeota archaeon]MBO3842354.1 phosphate ABC transporter permease PstA [Candidatus Brockarchaeota archaeon]
MASNYRIRKVKDCSMRFLIWFSLLIALIPLFSILLEVFLNGAHTISVEFFTLPTPTVGETGGIANAVQGTLITLGLASLIGVPTGLMAGIFLSEYGGSKLSSVIRFTADVLSGFPSIVIGIFGYTLIVTSIGFSVAAASFALAIIMIPIVTRTTEEALKLVPVAIREAALALGIQRWKTTVFIVLSGAKKGIVTGVLLALARIAGESAPILITMGYWRWWFSWFDKPASNLALNIYLFAISPFENWRSLAWGSALILMMLILGISILVRVLTREKY